MASPPIKAGRYEVVRELGRGSMGVVYQGFDPVIGRTVAIKTMLTEGLAPNEFQEYRARFQREAQAAGVLNHPNIVSVYDYGEDSGVLYLIMEFLEGKSLEKLIEGRKILPIETIIPMCEQVCGALDHAHQRGIVHRDIKPANIMILDNGIVKVTDFGIAKMVSMGMTQTGLVLGTPNYMSPEQVKGRQVDGRSDIFSLGIILYDLVTGEKPFAGQNITTVIYKIINENPIPPRELDATIHPGLSYVICKALAKNPDERYQTCRELADDLKNFKALGGQVAPSATMILKATPAPSGGTDRPAAPSVSPPTPPAAQAPPVQAAPAQQPSPGQVPTQVIAPSPAYQKPRTSPMVWVLVSVLAVVFLGILGGGYIYLHKGNPQLAKPLVGQLHVDASIPGAMVSVDGQSGPSWVTPCTIIDLSPGSHQVVVSKEGYDNYQQAVTIEGGKTNSIIASLPAHSPEAPSTTLAEEPAAAPGKLKASEARAVNPLPSASGRGHGSTTPPAARREAVGAASLSATSGGAPGPSSLPAASGGTPGGASLPAASGGGPNPAPTMGQLLVTANVAGARISIDGASDPGWITPYSSPINRPAGTHQVVVSKDGYSDYQQSLTIEGGKTTTINAQLAQLEEAGGEVVVITTPPGLDVLIDGKLIGPSPVHINLSAGSHKYTVKRQGWEPYEGTVNVRSGAEMTVRVNMGG